MAALPEMATAVVILNEDRLVEYVNASAETLFTPVDPLACTLPARFASCGATGGDDVFAAVDADDRPAPVRLKLADDRLLDCTLRALSSGGFVLSMDDVTTYVRNAELAERDTLTGLANRKAFRERLAERLAAASGRGTTLQYCSSISIASKRSTIPWAILWATLCCARSRNGSRASCANGTWWGALAVTSSRSSRSARRNPPPPRRWPNASWI
jgi:hypothetical protein